jgi:hypothetical protein
MSFTRVSCHLVNVSVNTESDLTLCEDCKLDHLDSACETVEIM